MWYRMSLSGSDSDRRGGFCHIGVSEVQMQTGLWGAVLAWWDGETTPGVQQANCPPSQVPPCWVILDDSNPPLRNESRWPCYQQGKTPPHPLPPPLPKDFSACVSMLLRAAAVLSSDGVLHILFALLIWAKERRYITHRDDLHLLIHRSYQIAMLDTLCTQNKHFSQTFCPPLFE